ncbi:MAG: hypothetical protein KGL39_36730 [Patescibacteria group bacterium]|nr:hypothetical protein [Patescibacteria group bacterium]
MKFNKWSLRTVTLSLAILVLAFISTFTARAQSIALTNVVTQTNIVILSPNTNNTASLQGGINMLLAAFENSISNSYWVAYGMKASGLPKQYGGGIGWFNPLSQYVVTGVRVDYIDGSFWMPSGSASLQLPLHLSSYFTLTPFTYAGVGVPLSGATIQVGNLINTTVPGTVRDNNGQPTAILGYGVAVDLYQGTDWKLKALYDRETWTGFSGIQQRVGIAYSSNKPGLFGMGLNLGIIKL